MHTHFTKILSARRGRGQGTRIQGSNNIRQSCTETTITIPRGPASGECEQPGIIINVIIPAGPDFESAGSHSWGWVPSLTMARKSQGPTIIDSFCRESPTAIVVLICGMQWWFRHHLLHPFGPTTGNPDQQILHEPYFLQSEPRPKTPKGLFLSFEEINNPIIITEHDLPDTVPESPVAPTSFHFLVRSRLKTGSIVPYDTQDARHFMLIVKGRSRWTDSPFTLSSLDQNLLSEGIVHVVQLRSDIFLGWNDEGRFA